MESRHKPPTTTTTIYPEPHSQREVRETTPVSPRSLRPNPAQQPYPAKGTCPGLPAPPPSLAPIPLPLTQQQKEASKEEKHQLKLGSIGLLAVLLGMNPAGGIYRP